MKYSELSNTEISQFIGIGKDERKPDGYSIRFRGELIPTKAKTKEAAKKALLKIACEKGINPISLRVIKFWKVVVFGGREVTIEE